MQAYIALPAVVLLLLTGCTLDLRGTEWKKFYNANVAAREPVNRGAGNLFSAAKWTPRESGLIGPVTIAPLEKFDPIANK